MTAAQNQVINIFKDLRQNYATKDFSYSIRLNAVILTESWVEGKSIVRKKVHNKQQANPFKSLGQKWWLRLESDL